MEQLRQTLEMLKVFGESSKAASSSSSSSSSSFHGSKGNTSSRGTVDISWVEEQLEAIRRAHIEVMDGVRAEALQEAEREKERLRKVHSEELDGFTGRFLEMERKMGDDEKKHSEELSATVAASLLKEEEEKKLARENERKREEQFTLEFLQLEQAKVSLRFPFVT